MKDAPMIVRDRAGLAVHQVRRADDSSAKSRANGLMSETNSQDWNFAREVPNQVDADTGFLRCAWSRRDHDSLRLHRLNFVDRDLIVAPNFHLRAKFSEILDEVVGKGIVIVENEDHGIVQRLVYTRSNRAEAPVRNQALRVELFSPRRNVPFQSPTVVLTDTALNVMLVHSQNATLFALEPRMAEAQEEKRAARRFALRIPVSVARGENSTFGESAEIRDVSARGICLYLDAPIEEGSPIGFTLTLPPEITLTESIRVQCKGRVVRIEGGTAVGKMAVAAIIEEYEFLPES